MPTSADPDLIGVIHLKSCHMLQSPSHIHSVYSQLAIQWTFSNAIHYATKLISYKCVSAMCQLQFPNGGINHLPKRQLHQNILCYCLLIWPIWSVDELGLVSSLGFAAAAAVMWFIFIASMIYSLREIVCIERVSCFYNYFLRGVICLNRNLWFNG